VINLFKGDNNQNAIKSDFVGRGKVFLNYLGRFVWVPPKPDLFVEKGLCRELAGFKKNAYPEMIGLVILSLLYFIYLSQKTKDENIQSSARIVISIFVLSLFAVFLYNRGFQEYYLLFLMPYLAIILGVAVSGLWQKKALEPYIFLFFILFLTVNMITLFTAGNSYSYLKEKETIEFAKKYLQSGNYSLEALGDCPRFAGWRYLFEYYNGRPVSSYMDSYFGWLYQDKKNIPAASENTVLLSMIDSRGGLESIVKWQEEKINFLTKFQITAEKFMDNIHVFVLTPRK